MKDLIGHVDNSSYPLINVNIHMTLVTPANAKGPFISYGIPEKGDAHWLDHQGSFMATVDAGRVLSLLGAKGLDVSGDYRTAKFQIPSGFKTISEREDTQNSWTVGRTTISSISTSAGCSMV